MCVIFQTQSGKQKAEKKNWRREGSKSGKCFENNFWSRTFAIALIAFWFNEKIGNSISAHQTDTCQLAVSISADLKIADNIWRHWLTAPSRKNPKIDANFYLLPHFFLHAEGEENGTPSVRKFIFVMETTFLENCLNIHNFRTTNYQSLLSPRKDVAKFMWTIFLWLTNKIKTFHFRDWRKREFILSAIYGAVDEVQKNIA